MDRPEPARAKMLQPLGDRLDQLAALTRIPPTRPTFAERLDIESDLVGALALCEQDEGLAAVPAIERALRALVAQREGGK